MMERTYSAFLSEEEYWKELQNWASGLEQADCSGDQRWAVLEGRVQRSSQEGLLLPLPYVQAAFGLEDYQSQALALLLLEDRTGTGEPLTLHRVLELLAAGDDAVSVREQLCRQGDGWELCLEHVPQESAAPIRVASRILDGVLAGHLDLPALSGLTLVHPEQAAVANPQEDLADRMYELVRSGVSERITFLILGQSGSGRGRLVCSFTRRFGSPLLAADGRRLISREGSEFRKGLMREAVLQRCPVVLTGMEELLADSASDIMLAEELTELLTQLAAPSGISILIAEEDWQPTEAPYDWMLVPVRLPQPGAEESAALWKELLNGSAIAPEVSGEHLAGKYRLTPGQIRRAVRDASAMARWEGREEITAELLDRACRRQLRHRLGDKARRVETVFTWDELILPDGAKRLLRSACDQVRYRSRVYDSWGFGQKLSYGSGLSLLFSGPPGTGKTMAAQVAAAELGLELYKVELPAIVSKYVGETEKNLRDIFKEAARSQAILFFDEADVLFAKRTEMKDAQDKYSNMEAAYLLQKMEEYPGISILATNFLQNFDEAFKRRLKFIIEFPFPDRDYRLRLWQSVFPSRTPLDRDVDLEFLAQQFELSGSAIKNTAVNAAFLAAGEAAPVGMRHLLIALRRELQKSGKSLSRQDFGPYYMLVEEESHGSV